MKKKKVSPLRKNELVLKWLNDNLLHDFGLHAREVHISYDFEGAGLVSLICDSWKARKK